jgi:putative transposase
LDVQKSGLYYVPSPESDLNIELMELIDKQYLKQPRMGVPSMTDWLNLDNGYEVNRKRIRRLYKKMGLQSLVPGPHTSKGIKEHNKYPYLLRSLIIERVNQVWAIDITYIPVAKGFFYLVAIIDIKSRYVVGWSISNTMDAEWCRDLMQECIEKYGKPEIVNTDQGGQFTSEVFTSYLLEQEVKISMDGKGRALDNIFIERLWRSVKYEDIYLKSYATGPELFIGLLEYFNYYNNERRHTSIDKLRPVDVYTGKTIEKTPTEKVKASSENNQYQASDLPQAQHKSVLTVSESSLNESIDVVPKREF